MICFWLAWLQKAQRHCSGKGDVYVLVQSKQCCCHLGHLSWKKFQKPSQGFGSCFLSIPAAIIGTVTSQTLLAMSDARASSSKAELEWSENIALRNPLWFWSLCSRAFALRTVKASKFVVRGDMQIQVIHGSPPCQTEVDGLWHGIQDS